MMFAIMGILTGCGEGEIDERLVGTWSWQGNSTWRYVFNADGTGTRPNWEGGVGSDRFTWSVSGNRLTLRLDNRANETWRFTLSDDVLTLTRQNLTYTYNRR